MGKFIPTKFSGHQHRVVRKRPGKSIARCLPEKLLPKKTKTASDEQHEKPEEPLSSKPESDLEKLLGKNEDVSNSDYQDLRFEVASNQTGGKYLKLVKQDCDLFADDELKARYDQFTKYNLIFIIFDEIALEGLDGITIEALWKRIQHTMKLENLSENLKGIIWKIISMNEKIKLFELPEARAELRIVDMDMDILNYASDPFVDIYKFEQATKDSGEWGSCTTLSTRVDISEQVRNKSLDEVVTTYGNKLVLVADEELRKNALFDDIMDPNYEFSQTEYCVLERIGRSRDAGETTLGPRALSCSFGIDRGSVYHYCKRLTKENLVTRQYCFLSSLTDQTKVGRLFHLRRFYRKRKSKYALIIENIINYLKKCPGFRAPYSSIRELFAKSLCGKFFKNPDLNKYVDTNVYIPYKEYHTGSTFKQYMTKSLSRERVVQLMQLKDPYVNIAACWVEGQNDDSSDDEEDEGDSDINKGRRIYNKDIIRDIYQYILSTGKQGVKTPDLAKIFDIDFPMLRNVLRKLCTRQLIYPKKCDFGRQTFNLFIATCLSHNQDSQVGQPEIIHIRTSSTLENLRQRQKRKIDSLNEESVYKLEQFAADREEQLFSSDKCTLLPFTFPVPQIICDYLAAADMKVLASVEEMSAFVVRLTEAPEPFKIKLKLSRIPDTITWNLSSISFENNEQNIEIRKNVKEFMGELSTDKFKPDYFSKAILLRALLDKLKLNDDEIIDFLDPDNSSRKAEKRPLEFDTQRKRKRPVNDTSSNKTKSSFVLGKFMGLNPIIAMTEIDEESGFVMEVHATVPFCEYKTGDITYYIDDLSSTSTDRTLSRISLILRTVQEQQVFEEVHRLLRLILTQESAAGYKAKMDRKSLHRLLARLANEGYIKIFTVIFAKEETRKVQTYVCHPQVCLTTNYLLQESINRMKEKIYFIVKTDVIKTSEKSITVKAKRSPFIEADVLRSLKEIKELTSKSAAVKTIKKSGKHGRRPKFTRLSLLHELLFYLIYEFDKDTEPLSKSEVFSLFQEYDIKLTETDLDNLPPVYCREISWKTFIPPMPHHQGWGKGWALLVDVLLRMPITLITQCFSVNFVSLELQEILHHPIKRFYLLRYTSPNIRNVIMSRRKIIHDMYGQLLLLCYCGLLQFGPSSFHYKEKSFLYLNRKATLWDTTSSAPGYQIIEEKEYPEHRFEFGAIEDVLNYWSTLKKICTHTNLNTRSLVEGKTITLVDPSAKPGLNKAQTVKTHNRAIQCDTGELPGDHKGAAGLDSSLSAHVRRNWHFFTRRKVATAMDFLETLRLDQVANKRVAFDELKLPPSTNKYYIARPQETKLPSNPRKIKPCRTGKKIPIIKRTVTARKKKLQGKKEKGLDAVDKMTLRKVSSLRHRPHWSEEEDRLLILLKIASRFITPGTTKQVINYSAFRDFLHIVEPKCRDKTSRSICNRLKILRKTTPMLSNVESLIPNLFKLVPIVKYFLPFRTFVIHGSDPSGMNRKFKVSDAELTNAFLFLAYYFLTHRKEVEVSLHGRNISTDYFSKENIDFFKQIIQPFDQEKRFYSDPESEDDIRKCTLKNTIHSALSNKSDKPTSSLQLYKVYQQYSEDILKSVLQEMRDQRMIQLKKITTQTSSSPFRISLHYIIGQCSTFLPHTMEEAYQTFLDLKYNPNEVDYSHDSSDERNYGQLFALNEILTVMLNNATFHFKIPEHHLVLNPFVEDHSEVIDELAKRYQAKLKNDQKETDSQSDLQSSTKAEEDISDAIEPEAGPSSTTDKEPEFEIINFEDDEPLDLSITAKNSTTIDNLKHWISDCIDAERVRSPSPELLHLEVSEEPKEPDVAKEANTSVPTKDKEDRVLTLEEIKEEMLKPSNPNEKRLVPYISDLTKLLSVTFEEIESDERASYLMKRYFVQQYPSVEKIVVDDLGGHYLADFLENRTSIEDIWVRVEREAQISPPNDESIAFEQILKKGGTIEDMDLACALLNYIKGKGIHGTTGYEIKENFSSYERNCSLELILRVLIDNNIIMRTGVCTIVFVHYQYRDPWLSENFMLTQELTTLCPDKAATSEELKTLEADVDRVGISKWIKINPLPWTTIDGLLNKDLFKMWLSQVFSYCVENPMLPLTVVFDKFCYLKPVDVFYLVEVLEEIGALEMRLMSVNPVTLFSEYGFNDENKATFLDKFDEICVEASNIGFTTLGSFFHSL